MVAGRARESVAETQSGTYPVKTNLIVGVAALAFLGLTGCDSNDRNRDYNSTNNRDASMGDTATSTGSGGNRGYYVPEHRMGNNSGYNGNSTTTGTGTTTRPRHTSDPGMGMVDEKAKDGCCAASCDKSGKQN